MKAFMRDEGPRYDPELAYNLFGIVLSLFHRKLGQGDLPVIPAVASDPSLEHSLPMQRIK
jgi:carboxymethylenebutenolidase